MRYMKKILILLSVLLIWSCSSSEEEEPTWNEDSFFKKFKKYN